MANFVTLKTYPLDSDLIQWVASPPFFNCYCCRWMAKHFDRVLASKGFATLPKKLQEEILAEIERSFVS